MANKTSTITINKLKAYVCEPEEGSKCGVLVLPTVVGIDRQMREYGEWIANAGLAALAWDPFSAHELKGKGFEERRDLSHKLEDAVTQKEQSTWIGYMLDQMKLERVAVIGFCMGGRMALILAAKDPRLSGCVAYYPSIREALQPNETVDAVALAYDIRCPVQVHYPGKDRVMGPPTFRRLRDALESRPAATSIHIYPDAEHGFTESHRQSNAGNSDATHLSWPQATAFLRACLL